MPNDPPTNPPGEPPEPSGSAADNDNPKPEEVVRRSFPGLLASASAVGMTVFLVTSFGALLFLFLANISEFSGTSNDYRLFRSLEIVLTLSALGIVVLFLSRQPSPLVATFSIFVVGALIIPSKDIVRLALIVTGSEKNIEDFFGTGIVGPDLQGRADDAAAKIVSEVLNFNGYRDETRPNIAEAERRRLVKNISNRIYEERVLTILERVKSRGSFELLVASESDFQDFMYKHSSHEKFVEDVRFLRSEDLISFAYGDLQSIQVTPTGRDVLRWASTGELSPSRTSQSDVLGSDLRDRVSSLFGRPGQFAEDECTDFLARSSQLAEIRLNAEDDESSVNAEDDEGSRSVQLDVDYAWHKVSLDNKGEFEISLSVAETSPIDPYLVLMARENNECTLISFDDDGGTALNSRMKVELEAGAYVLGVRAIGIGGDATLEISKM